MGNLDYIKNTIMNDIRIDLRYNRNRINQDSGLAVSSNTAIGYDKEGKEITIEDTLAADEDESEESLGYQSTLQCIKRIMADRFSDREIDQIIRYDGSPLVLSRNLYVKLTNWRKKHKPEEVLNR